MAYYITEDCINCVACEPECPNQAIREGDTIFVIDPNCCTECVGSFKSSRCAAVCPVDACHLDPRHQEIREQLLKKWQSFHPDKTPAPET
jgi:ferredoxin